MGVACHCTKTRVGITHTPTRVNRQPNGGMAMNA